MTKLEDHLRQEGYYVVNIGYPSREKPIQELAEEELPKSIEPCLDRDFTKIHFVTHSLGGILVRYYLAHHRLKELGRVVMLSPPSKGSEVVDKLGSNILFQWLNGPAGSQLGTDEKSVPNQLGKIDYDVGIITGDRSINLFLSLLIPGVDDGKVSVERAKLEGMKDFLVVHTAHPFIMKNNEVLRQVSAFLKNGEFEREDNPPEAEDVED